MPNPMRSMAVTGLTHQFPQGQWSAAAAPLSGHPHGAHQCCAATSGLLARTPFACSLQVLVQRPCSGAGQRELGRKLGCNHPKCP